MRSEAQIRAERTQQLEAWETAQSDKIRAAWSRLSHTQREAIRAKHIQPNDRCPDDLPAHVLSDLLGVRFDPYPKPSPDFIRLSRAPAAENADIYERFTHQAPVSSYATD